MSDVPINFVDRVLLFDNADYREEAGGHRRQFRADLPPGSACWAEGRRALQFTCPCGCGRVHAATIRGSASTMGWSLAGTPNNPSLQPSLGLHPLDHKAGDGSQYHWHGFLIDGVFKPCKRG